MLIEVSSDQAAIDELVQKSKTTFGERCPDTFRIYALGYCADETNERFLNDDMMRLLLAQDHNVDFLDTIDNGDHLSVKRAMAHILCLVVDMLNRRFDAEPELLYNSQENRDSIVSSLESHEPKKEEVKLIRQPTN